MGKAVAMGIRDGLWEREDLVISTKLMWGGRGARDSVNSVGLSRKHLVEGMRRSLERMELDHVDLLFCHRPDTRTPIWETVRVSKNEDHAVVSALAPAVEPLPLCSGACRRRKPLERLVSVLPSFCLQAMNFLIDQGLIFYWGTSMWEPAELKEACTVAEKLGMIPPLFDQCNYSMLERTNVEATLAPFYPNLGTTIFGGLASGLLSGKYNADSKSWRPVLQPRKSLPLAAALAHSG